MEITVMKRDSLHLVVPQKATIRVLMIPIQVAKKKRSQRTVSRLTESRVLIVKENSLGQVHYVVTY